MGNTVAVRTTTSIRTYFIIMNKLFLALAFILTSMAVHAQPRIGTNAPEISLPDANGETVSLSSLKGKVVLIDFWASWCGPCRQNNKLMVPVYKQYKDKGLEVFGVSIDANKNAWKNAVKQDKMEWMQVIDVRAEQGNELTRLWNIQYIPSTYLLDKEGKIIAIGLETEELKNWLKRLL